MRERAEQSAAEERALPLDQGHANQVRIGKCQRIYDKEEYKTSFLFFRQVQSESSGAVGKGRATGTCNRGSAADRTGGAAATGPETRRGRRLGLRDVQQAKRESDRQDTESLHAGRRVRDSSTRLLHKEGTAQAAGTRRKSRAGAHSFSTI